MPSKPNKPYIYEQEKQQRMAAALDLQWESEARRELERILAKNRVLAQDGRANLGYAVGPVFEANARRELEETIRQRRNNQGETGSMRY